MLGENAWLSLHSSSSQRCWVGLRSGLCVGQSSSSTPNTSNHDSWTLLCALSHSHAGLKKGLPQFFSHNNGSIELPKMSWHAKALSFSFTGRGRAAQPLKNSPTLLPFLQQTLHCLPAWLHCAMFSWHLPNPDSPIRLPNREAWLVLPQNRVPLLQWRCALLRPVWGVAVSVSLVCLGL